MKIKYVLCPSYNVGMDSLMSLYRVPRKECISWEQHKKYLGSGTEKDTSLIYLHPRRDGKYEEWLQKEIEGRNF